MDTDTANHSPPHGTEQSSTNSSPEPDLSLEDRNALLEEAQQYEHNASNSPEYQIIMCRDFIRGTCSRAPGACRYAHERVLSQLPGVYTFCKNFQNTVCTYPVCKYVHATVFEEQRFYRTGFLPPQVLARHTHTGVLPPEVLAHPTSHHRSPPDHATTRRQESCATTDSSPRRITRRPEGKKVAPPRIPVFEEQRFYRTGFLPPQVLARHTHTGVLPPEVLAHPTSHHRSPPDHATATRRESCNSCATMDSRLQIQKDKTENMKQSATELNNKMARLDTKSDMLGIVLIALSMPNVILSNLLDEPVQSPMPERRYS